MKLIFFINLSSDYFGVNFKQLNLIDFNFFNLNFILILNLNLLRFNLNLNIPHLMTIQIKNHLLMIT